MCYLETIQRGKAVYVRHLEALTLQISIPTQNMSAFNGASTIIIIIIIINNMNWVADTYLLTAIGLTPRGSSTVHIYTQRTHRTTELTTRTTKLHQNNTINNNNNNNNTVNNLIGNSAGRAPSLKVLPWHLPYNWGKSTEKPKSVSWYDENRIYRTYITITIHKHNNKNI